MTVNEKGVVFADILDSALMVMEECAAGGAEAEGFVSLFEEVLAEYAEATLESEHVEALRKIARSIPDCQNMDVLERLFGEWRFADDGTLRIDPERNDPEQMLYVSLLIFESAKAVGSLGEGDAYAMKIWLNNDRDKIDILAVGGKYHIMGATVGRNTILPDMVDWLNRHPGICMLDGHEELFLFTHTLQAAAVQFREEELWRFVLEFIQNIAAGRVASTEKGETVYHIPVVRERDGRVFLEPTPVVFDGHNTKGESVLKEVEEDSNKSVVGGAVVLARQVEDVAKAFVSWAERDDTEKADRLLEEFVELLYAYSNSVVTRKDIDSFMVRANQGVEDEETVRLVMGLMDQIRSQMQEGALKVSPLNNLAMFHAGLMVSSMRPFGKGARNRVNFWLDDIRNHIGFFHCPESGRIFWRDVVVSRYKKPKSFMQYVEENQPFFEFDPKKLYSEYIPWINNQRQVLADAALCLSIYRDVVNRCHDNINRMSRWYRMENGTIAFEGGVRIAVPSMPECPPDADEPHIAIVPARKRIVDGQIELTVEETAGAAH